MEIIEAYWEKRNLGVDAYEIKLSVQDEMEITKLGELLTEKKYANSYITVKLPVGNLKPVHDLENLGFRFMETQMVAELNLETYNSPEGIEHGTDVKREEIDKQTAAWEENLKLMTPDMFHTDRIYLDPRLNKSMAFIRYKNWILDSARLKNCHLYNYWLDSEPIGFDFVTFKNEKQEVVHNLVGLYEKYQGKGLGKVMYDAALSKYKAEGVRKITDAISSNNPAVIKLLGSLGYEFNKFVYVLSKI